MVNTKGRRKQAESKPKKVKSSSTKGTILSSVKAADGSIIRPGDSIHLRAAKSQPPFVAKVLKLLQNDKQTMVHVTWYYRPADTQGGVKAFHGERELFTSDHEDMCELETIHGKCNVHKLKAYQKLERVREGDYFCRFSYKACTGLFKPDRVPVYCICEMPYNPDQFMVECEVCAEWFHPECLKLTQKDVMQACHFVCLSCRPPHQDA